MLYALLDLSAAQCPVLIAKSVLLVSHVALHVMPSIPYLALAWHFQLNDGSCRRTDHRWIAMLNAALLLKTSCVVDQTHKTSITFWYLSEAFLFRSAHSPTTTLVSCLDPSTESSRLCSVYSKYFRLMIPPLTVLHD